MSRPPRLSSNHVGRAYDPTNEQGNSLPAMSLMCRSGISSPLDQPRSGAPLAPANQTTVISGNRQAMGRDPTEGGSYMAREPSVALVDVGGTLWSEAWVVAAEEL